MKGAEALAPRTTAISNTYGCSLQHLRLQPPAPTVAASNTYGCSLQHLRLRPPAHTVAASNTYGCSLEQAGLQLLGGAASHHAGWWPGLAAAGNDRAGHGVDDLGDAGLW